MFRKSHKVKIRADDLIVGSEIYWWFPNILPLGSGLIGMVPKNPATRARINRNGSDSSGSEISCDTGHRSRSSLAMRCHSQIARPTPCVMLIGLAWPKKVFATVKLCFCGGECEAKCVGSFSQAKYYRVSFLFTPKLSNLVVVITEESDFL